jgi:hypothetical protein
MSDKIVFRTGAAIVALHLLASTALAVDTMSDWVGQNSNPGNTTFTVVTTTNNYGLISDTSAGGTLQSKINFHSVGEPTYTGVLDDPHVFFSDPTLVDGGGLPITLDFTTPLHMEGTITFNSPQMTEPNLLFGWYSSLSTAHRIGLGISNRTVAQGGAIADRLRVDFGYASTSYPNPNPPPANLGNKFYYVSADGATAATEVNSTVPNGTYPFTFDYTPGTIGATGGGSISATVGTFFETIQPLETDPEDNDFFTFDRFGFVQRSTANVTQLGDYSITFSNVTYTGGTAAAVAIPGDFDGDLDVDATDLGIWSTNFGTGTTVATGDADNDGDADGNDFLIWQQNLSIAPVAAVPEPAALTIATASIVAVFMLRPRRR